MSATWRHAVHLAGGPATPRGRHTTPGPSRAARHQRHHVDGGLSVSRLRATWASERPFGELQGGGPELFYHIEAADPTAWLDSATPMASALRQMAEDLRFFEALGPDAGPECCREPGCTRLRINPGLYCRCHHFEMVMRRTCPFWEREAAR